MTSLVRSICWLVPFGFVASVGVTACSDIAVAGGDGVAHDSTVHSVTVTPPSDTVAVLRSVTLAASVDAGGFSTNRTVNWSSSDITVATVDSTGVVTGLAVGRAFIVATSRANPQVSGSAAVTVTPAVGAAARRRE